MKRCQHCGGDGYNDLYEDNICALCGGSGEVPDTYWWDSEGTLHMTDDAPEERKDGFRKRRNTRPKGWQEKAIKSGEIADPKVGPQPHQTYSSDQTVIEPEVATLSASGDET